MFCHPSVLKFNFSSSLFGNKSKPERMEQNVKQLNKYFTQTLLCTLRGPTQAAKIIFTTKNQVHLQIPKHQ